MKKHVTLHKLPLGHPGGSLSHLMGEREYLSTGISSLDNLLGGGWPLHDISYIQGGPGAGKSALCAEAAISYLINGGDLAIILSRIGDHPQPGFGSRVAGKNVVILRMDMVSARPAIQNLLEAARDAILIVDDLPGSLPDSISADRETWRILREFISSIRPYLYRRLTLLLSNQIRETNSGLVGAVTHNYSTQISKVCVHVSTRYSDESGVESEATILSPPDLCGKSCIYCVKYNYGVVG